MRETQYQRDLIKRIRKLIPGCEIMRNDPRQLQGVPDILILYNRTWAMLEVKLDDGSPVQPNQQHYVAKFGAMSYASFINPDNEREVLYDLQRALGVRRPTRISQS